MVNAYYGLAPCDVAAAILREIKRGVDALVLAFSGNNLSPCMRSGGDPLTGARYYDAYRHEIGRLTGAARDDDIPVVIVGPPAFPAAQNRPDRAPLNSLFQSVATSVGAQYVATSTVLSPHGFTRTLPCASGENAPLGCNSGRVTVRSGNGIHFDALRQVPCPAGRGVCRYSAGGHRYADVILSALARIPELHAAPPPADAGVPLDAVTATP